MIRLQTLGALDLSAADGTALQPVLRQTKRFALLAYMAIERPGQFFRRDQLLGLFWPESDLKGGRASLSQALHFLRQHLGKQAIVSRGDEEIGLDPDLVWCDAAEFQEHMAAGRYEAAMELYGGQLLPAYFVDEASGFEQWLEQKRDALQRDAMRACGALADVAEQEGRHDDVVKWLRRAISYQPYDESLHRRLIIAFDRAGDRASALRVYDELVQALRAEFDAPPSAETIEIIQAVRARSQARSAREQLAQTGYPARALPAQAPRHRRRTILVSAALVVLATAAGLWARYAARERADDPPMNRIAVLFFNDATPTRELTYLADGLTTALIDHLGNVRLVEVISQNGVRPFRGDSIPLDSIARQLDVGTIVGGTISRSDDKLRVTVEIVKGNTGILARSKMFERPTGELFALLDDIANEVGSFLRSTVGAEIRLQRYQSETSSVAAWQALRRAERLLTDAEVAVDRGENASAWALLERADTLLARAAREDRKWATPLILLADAHEQRAWLALGGGRSPSAHLDAAMAAAEQALQRARNSAAAYESRGRVQFIHFLINAPPLPQAAALLAAAEQDLAQALKIDPERARAESTLSMIYESQGRFEDARQAARRALAADAYLEDANQIAVRLFQASFELGDDVEAGHWCDEVRRRLTGKWPAAYCDLILLAWRSDGDQDPRKALFILETFGASDDPPLREAMRPRLTLLAATAVARAGDLARAETMVRQARTAAPDDPELLYYEAALRVQLQDHEQARQLLDRYLELNPNAAPRIQNGRMFKPLRMSQLTHAAVH